MVSGNKHIPALWACLTARLCDYTLYFVRQGHCSPPVNGWFWKEI